MMLTLCMTTSKVLNQEFGQKKTISARDKLGKVLVIFQYGNPVGIRQFCDESWQQLGLLGELPPRVLW